LIKQYFLDFQQLLKTINFEYIIPFALAGY